MTARPPQPQPAQAVFRRVPKPPLKDTMLNKLISRFKAPQAATPNPAHVAAADTISTLEKAAGLVAQLEAARDAEEKFSPRHRFFSKQHEEAARALKRHELDAERKRVASAVQRDKAAAEKSLSLADEQHAIASGNLNTALARREALTTRLEPLEAEKTQAQQQAEERALVAQKEFDAAISAGDIEAEKLAAAALYQAKNDCRSGSVLMGPIDLRINAIRSELAIASDLVSVQEAAIAQADQARLIAQAELALAEYDRQAQSLFDAFLKQRVAVNACLASLPNTAYRSHPFNGRAVDQFETQVSSPGRIVFGSSIDVYNNRYLPAHIYMGIFEAVSAEPNLAVLAASVDDLPAETVEPAVDFVTEQVG